MTLKCISVATGETAQWKINVKMVLMYRVDESITLLTTHCKGKQFEQLTVTQKVQGYISACCLVLPNLLTHLFPQNKKRGKESELGWFITYSDIQLLYKGHAKLL